MDEVIKQSGFSGTFPEFVNVLRTDPRFARVPTNDVLPGFRDIAKRVDPELPKLFAELPRTPYGIREIPAYRGETAAYYTPGAADGSRAGYFNANTLAVSTKPRHEMEALFLHEAVPGHHLQVARAQELRGLPDFRRNGLYNAYVEGWALYAESLGEDLGLYKDPYSKFGRLNGEIHRACRLVVDTGMHALGWTRDRAIAYMKANTSLSETFIVAEIDRYIVWPGQALGYKLGELKIKALRAKAAKDLGAKFDIRKFHNALIDDGPLPLDLLEQRIDAWIETQRWEVALRREPEARESYDRFRRELRRRLTPEELDRIRTLAADIPSLWNAVDTPAADRKEIVRTLVERVTVTVRGTTEHVVLRIEWIGGTSTEHSLRRPISCYQRLCDFPRMRSLVEAGRGRSDIQQIAECLNRRASVRYRTATSGSPRHGPGIWSTDSVSVRDAGRRSRWPDEWWVRDLSDELGVSYLRFKDWVKKGYVHVRRVGSKRHLVISGRRGGARAARPAQGLPSPWLVEPLSGRVDPPQGSLGSEAWPQGPAFP